MCRNLYAWDMVKQPCKKNGCKGTMLHNKHWYCCQHCGLVLTNEEYEDALVVYRFGDG